MSTRDRGTFFSVNGSFFIQNKQLIGEFFLLNIESDISYKKVLIFIETHKKKKNLRIKKFKYFLIDLNQTNI